MQFKTFVVLGISTIIKEFVVIICDTYHNYLILYNIFTYHLFTS